MAKQVIRFTNNHQMELSKILRGLAHRHHLWKVFCDFVAMAAISISNATDKQHAEQREAEYMRIVGQYSKDEANELARGFAHVVMGLECGMHDFLGALFMGLELGDTWKGQFFTPYEVSRLMAAMTLVDKARSQIEGKGFVSVLDPCVGGGAMLVAAAHALMDAGVNYQAQMHAVGVDIDIVAVHMAYVQLSLLHVPAVIYHGNSLSMEVRSVWRTPAHTLGFWERKLRRAGDSCELIAPAPTGSELAELGIGAESVVVAPIRVGGGESDLPRVEVLHRALDSVNLRAQGTLF